MLLGKTVPELRLTLGGITEYANWQAYLDLYPPEKTGWEMSAMLAVNQRRCVGDKRSKMHDFMPDYDDPAVQKTKAIATILPGMPEDIAKRFVASKEKADG